MACMDISKLKHSRIVIHFVDQQSWPPPLSSAPPPRPIWTASRFAVPSLCPWRAWSDLVPGGRWGERLPSYDTVLWFTECWATSICLLISHLQLPFPRNLNGKASKEGWGSGRMQNRSILELWTNELSISQEPYPRQVCLWDFPWKKGRKYYVVYFYDLSGLIKSTVFCSWIPFGIGGHIVLEFLNTAHFWSPPSSLTMFVHAFIKIFLAAPKCQGLY